MKFAVYTGTNQWFIRTTRTREDKGRRYYHCKCISDNWRYQLVGRTLERGKPFKWKVEVDLAGSTEFFTYSQANGNSLKDLLEDIKDTIDLFK